MNILHFYQPSKLSKRVLGVLNSKIQEYFGEANNVQVLTESCYNVGISSALTEEEDKRLCWVLMSSFNNVVCYKTPHLEKQIPDNSLYLLFEYGPRLNYASAFSTNAISICHGAGLQQIDRLELSRRYLIIVNDLPEGRSLDEFHKIVDSVLHDKMTEMIYLSPLTSFDVQVKPEHVYEINITELGKSALTKANDELGLALEEWDIEYYYDLFNNKLHRNPTNVECFDLAQSNSEHSRHWFFKGKMVIDGVEMSKSLMQLVVDTQEFTNDNNVIKFNDNSR